MLLSCLLYIPYSWAQTDSLVVSSLPLTEYKTDFRIPDKKKIEGFQKDKRFDYSKEKEQGVSAWDRFQLWLFEKFGKLFNVVSNSGVAGIVVIVIIALLFSLLMLKFLGIDFRKVLGKKEIDAPEIDFYTENVNEMNFDSLISNALKNKDYRLVTRFLYLKNLKLLSDKEIIDWRVNKTNYSYQHEISNPTLRSKFLEITLIFDYIWYGEFPVSEESFIGIHARMDDFNKMVANER